jgi:hypothetical protein
MIKVVEKPVRMDIETEMTNNAKVSREIKDLM